MFQQWSVMQQFNTQNGKKQKIKTNLSKAFDCSFSTQTRKFDFWTLTFCCNECLQSPRLYRYTSGKINERSSKRASVWHLSGKFIEPSFVECRYWSLNRNSPTKRDSSYWLVSWKRGSFSLYLLSISDKRIHIKYRFSKIYINTSLETRLVYSSTTHLSAYQFLIHSTSYPRDVSNQMSQIEAMK